MRLAPMIAIALLLSVPAYAEAGHEGHNMPGMAGMAVGMTMAASPTVQATLTPQGEVVPGKPLTLTLKLRDKFGRPLRPNDLDIIHTMPVHFFVVDGSLTDYQHLHPAPGAADGEWTVTFTPQKMAYKAWVEVEPTGDADQLVPLTIGGVVPNPAALGREQQLTATVGGLRFTLSLAMPPQAGQGTLAIVNVYDAQGIPVTALEPIMGAYAHLVGIDGKLDNLMHIHPSGAEPESASDRGGPLLNFQLMPHVGGMHKLFLQVIYRGQTITAPFVVDVAG